MVLPRATVVEVVAENVVDCRSGLLVDWQVTDVELVALQVVPLGQATQLVYDVQFRYEVEVEQVEADAPVQPR